MKAEENPEQPQDKKMDGDSANYSKLKGTAPPEKPNVDEVKKQKEGMTYRDKRTTRKLKKVTSLSMEGDKVLEELEQDSDDLQNIETAEQKKRAPEIEKIVEYLMQGHVFAVVEEFIPKKFPKLKDFQKQIKEYAKENARVEEYYDYFTDLVLMTINNDVLDLSKLVKEDLM